ncbi:LOW QUALITY PROTEIN: crossover junction endonuclease MUS81 [Ammospiza maritima maritima]
MAAAAAASSRRRRRPRGHPNPLFARWLREWRDEAQGTWARGTYERALRSLSRFPLPLRSGRAAAILQHFGPALCARLDQRLKQHRRGGRGLKGRGLERAWSVGGWGYAGTGPSRHAPLGRGGAQTLPQPRPRATPASPGPSPRSRGHALLQVLSQSPEPLPEAELLQQAQPLCDHALTPAALGPPPAPGARAEERPAPTEPPDSPGTFHENPPQNPQTHLRPSPETTWDPPGTPRFTWNPPGCTRDPPRTPPHFIPSLPRYALTPKGRSLAEAPPPGRVCPQRPLAEQDENCAPSPPACDPEQEFELRPGEFEIVLCADVTEANGPSGGVPALLRSRGVPVLLRRLHVGDFLWVAREKDPPTGHAPRELALDVVVERKSAADLGNSIRDGRYREQKARLRRSGLRCPVFLLEAPGPGEPLPCPLPSLRQAAASTQGRVLRAWGGGCPPGGPPEPPGTPLALLPLQRLREGGGKNQAQTVGSVFARQLLQLGGLGGGRAGAVLSRFPTPARNLGPSLSGALVKLYGTPGPLD